MHLAPEISMVTRAHVLDVESAEVSQPSDIFIHEGRISSIESAQEQNIGAENSFDAENRIVIPGLIDGHVHVTASTADLGQLGNISPYLIAAEAKALMGGMLSRGFTTVRDVAGADYGLEEAVRRNLFIGPRLFFGGKALSQTGGHGDMRGPGEHVVDSHPCCAHLGLICDGVPEARRGARTQLRTGADHIKIMLSGGVSSTTDRIDSTQFSDEEITAIVQEAEAANRYVAGHAYTAKAVNRGVRLGVRSIEHGHLIDETSVDLFREYDAFLVPTLITHHRLKVEGAEHGLPEASQGKIEAVLQGGLEAVKLATEGQVNVVFGSDLLGGMNAHQSEEFRLRARVISAHQILRSATTTAAKLLQTDDLGVIRAGAHADLLVLEGNPLEDIGILAAPESSLSAIFKSGRQVRNPM